MIFQDFSKALAQFSDARFRRVLLLGVGLTLGLFVISGLGLWQLLAWIDIENVSLPFFGKVAWLSYVLGVITAALSLFAWVFLMIPVASAITAVFLDDVAQAVEDKHFPHLPAPPRMPLSTAIADTFSFLAVLIGANLLALMLYIMLPFAAPFIFYALNGFLLGREYFTLAATRREGRAGARALRSRHSNEIWLAGCLMAIPLTIPVLNLFVPILGAATFTHMYHRLSQR